MASQAVIEGLRREVEKRERELDRLREALEVLAGGKKPKPKKKVPRSSSKHTRFRLVDDDDEEEEDAPVRTEEERRKDYQASVERRKTCTKKLLRIFSSTPSTDYHVSELARKLRLSYSTATNYVVRLVKDGHVERVSPGTYQLVQKKDSVTTKKNKPRTNGGKTISSRILKVIEAQFVNKGFRVHHLLNVCEKKGMGLSRKQVRDTLDRLVRTKVLQRGPVKGAFMYAPA